MTMPINAIYQEKRERFLALLQEKPNVTQAAAGAGLDRTTVYQWQRHDPEFAAEWDRCLRIGVDKEIEEARRRAFEGVEEPVFYQGVQIATVKKYSDVLAMFLIKKHDPSFRDNYTLTVDAGTLATALAAARNRRKDGDDGGGETGA
jgi:hypothetical protein